MTKNRVKELSYYLFFALMILAKGIGLDSGDKLYYVLSAVACLCVGCKLLLTKYNIRQMAAMILLGLIAFVAYRNSGRMGILLSVLTIIGLKDMDVKKLFKLGTVIYGCSFVFTVIAAKLGIIGNPLVVHEKGGTEMIRWGMGYSTGNIFHVSYFILVVLLCYTWEKRYDIKKLIVLMVGNGLVFLFSLSYTGVAVTAFYLILNLYAVKRKRLSLAEKVIAQLPLPLCLIFSFGAPFLLDYPLVQRLDQMLQARLTFSAYYLQNQPVTLFGTRMKDVPNFWVIMDNGYVYFFMTFGVVAFVLFSVGYAVMIARFSGIRWKKGQNGGMDNDLSQECLPKLAMIFSFLLYGIMEQFISNAFMNVSLLFMGEILFGRTDGETICAEEPKLLTGVKKRKMLLGGTSVIAALVTGVVYLTTVKVPECVTVPLLSVNSVNAQSVLVHVVNEEGTKDGLKNQMEQYGQLLQDEETIKAALEQTGLTELLTVEEVVAALEWGLPQAVHSSKVYDTFRVRLLELYWDVEDVQYGALLNELVQNTSVRMEGIEEVYGEQVGKSFGTDRIEHISNAQSYMVEKSGDIVGIEYVRNGIFAVLFGGMVGYVLAAVIVIGEKYVYNRREKY